MIIPEWNGADEQWKCPDCGQALMKGEDQCPCCREDIDWVSQEV